MSDANPIGRPDWATVCRWVDAGKPDLSRFDEASANEEEGEND